jgi:Ca2+-binding RTX toxin-like protein
LKSAVKILGAEATRDRLTLSALGGADFVDASMLAAGLINLSLSGGPGDDLLLGSQGDDMILGNPGNDIVFMELGNDTFTWNPGDGSDVLEGQGGTDALIFNGSNAGEHIDVGPNNQRVRVARDVNGVVLDIDKIERIDLNPIGGTDTLTINNLNNTATSEINVRLAATIDGTTGDGVVDTVVINGTGGVDQFPIKGGLSGVSVLGPWAIVTITASEGAIDVLRVNALGSDDVVNAYQLPAGGIKLTLDGGPGNDQILGSAGNDVLDGGEGYDILIGGPGTDVGLNGEEVYEIP